MILLELFQNLCRDFPEVMHSINELLTESKSKVSNLISSIIATYNQY